MNLLKSENGYDVIPDPKVFLIQEFESLLHARNKNMSILTKELGYIYFMYDQESDFIDQTNELLRHNDVLLYINLPSSYQVDKYMEDCIKAFKILSETSQSKMLNTCRKAVSKLEEFIDNLNLNERDLKTGKPVWDFKKYQDSVKSMPDTMASLQKVEELYVKRREEQSKMRGDKTAAVFEDLEDVD